MQRSDYSANIDTFSHSNATYSDVIGRFEKLKITHNSISNIDPQNFAWHIAKQIQENMQMGNINYIDELFRQFKSGLFPTDESNYYIYNDSNHNINNDTNNMSEINQEIPMLASPWTTLVTWTTNTVPSSCEVPSNIFHQIPKFEPIQDQGYLSNTTQNNNCSYTQNNILAENTSKINNLYPTFQNVSQQPHNDGSFMKNKNISLNETSEETPGLAEKTFSDTVEKSSQNFINDLDQIESHKHIEQKSVSNSIPELQNTFHKDSCIILIEDDDFDEAHNQFPIHDSENGTICESDFYTSTDTSRLEPSNNNDSPMEIFNQFQSEIDTSVENQNSVPTNF